MDLFNRRQQFIINNFQKVFTELNLTDEVLKVLTDCERSNPLRGSNPLKSPMNVLAGFGNYDLEMFKQMDKEQLLEELKKSKRDVQKCFVISLFTQDRHPVDYLCEVLEKNNQTSVAKYLKEYNRSETPWAYKLDKYLMVNTTTNEKIGSQAHYLIGENKGLCYIFLNEEQFENQADLYRCVFREMGFKVWPQYYKSCEQIKSILANAANNREFQNYLSFIAIFVGHGADGVYSESRRPSIPEGLIKIGEILDIYAENKISPDGNYVNFNIKPKVFIIDSCRDRSKEIAEFHINEIGKKEWRESLNKTSTTFLLQPCAEGQVAIYSNRPDNKPQNGYYSHFGLPFCYTIAQYAIDQPLSELMKRTIQRMKTDFELRKLNVNYKEDMIQLPQETDHAAGWNLFFNPGC